MSATVWNWVSIVGFSLSALFLFISAFIFWRSDILTVIGVLTGRTAARQIKEMLEENEKSEQKGHKSNVYNIKRGPLTEQVESISQNKQTISPNTSDTSLDNEVTEMLAVETEKLSASTEMLQNNSETEVLSEKTAILSDFSSNETEILSEQPSKFKIVKKVSEVHTEEEL